MPDRPPDASEKCWSVCLQLLCTGWDFRRPDHQIPVLNEALFRFLASVEGAEELEVGQRHEDTSQSCSPPWPGEKGTAWRVGGVQWWCVCVCVGGGGDGGGGDDGGGVGGCRWWMTSPLRETFPQPAHKEGRQKVKRMRKNRNLTQCVKKEAKCGRAVSRWERDSFGGGVVFSFQRFRDFRGW